MNDSMKRLVENLDGLSSRDRTVLASVFRELEQQQKDLLHDIHQEVRASLKLRDELRDPQREAPAWRTATALVPADGYQNGAAGLYREILQDGPDVHREGMELSGSLLRENPKHVNLGAAFLHCRYSQLQAWLEKTYTADLSGKTREDAQGVPLGSAPYRLRLTTAFLHQEEWLEYAAVRNGVRRPPLYAPMSRRAVEVWADLSGADLSGVSQLQIDFQYGKNGLEDILLGGVELVWNVKEDSSAVSDKNTTKKLTPFGDQTYGVYEFALKRNEYIRVKNAGWDVRWANQKVYVNLQDGSETVRPSFSTFMLQDVPECTDAVEGPFWNQFDSDRMGRERIRTQADVAYVMARFQPMGLKFLACHLHLGNLQPVKIYEQEYAYHYPKSPHLRGKNTCCYLQVKRPESEEEWLYFEDSASYAAAYMNYFYPEFYWVVVI